MPTAMPRLLKMPMAVSPCRPARSLSFMTAMAAATATTEGRGERQDAQEQAEGHSGEGDVRQAVADHGVLAQDEEDAQDGAGDGDQDAGQEGPLEEAVGEKGVHGPLSARARRGGRRG